MLGRIEGRRRRGWQYKMVGWHHWLSRHEFEQALGDGEGQGSLVRCSPWGHKVSDTTEWLINKCVNCNYDGIGVMEGSGGHWGGFNVWESFIEEMNFDLASKELVQVEIFVVGDKKELLISRQNKQKESVICLKTS